MRKLLIILTSLFICFSVFAQDSNSDFTAEHTENKFYNYKNTVGTNGYEFTTLDTGINTRFSEFGSGFFKDKFIMVSSKKLGGFAKVDKTTGEGYKNLFCLDINKDGSLKSPLLFSRIINTFDNNEDQITFSPDENTMYFTRSASGTSSIYKLYKVTLEKDSHGNWIDEELLNINVDGYSIENPFVSPNGEKLYFASNIPNGNGGYDIYVSNIKEDGTLDSPVNLGEEVNTEYDDKYPSLSKDGNYLYFSSKGHANIGGFDVFKSKITKYGYRAPRNLGNTINTKYDEVAFFMASKSKGYLTSDKAFGKGKYDIYRFSVKEVSQNIRGVVTDAETKTPLPNTEIILIDEDGEEVSRVTSNKDAIYNLEVSPFESYTIKTNKDGFENQTLEFVSNLGDNYTYDKDLELTPKEAVIIKVEEKLMITVENIYFDYNKWTIKEESLLALNKILKVLNANPEMKIEINAHTDNRGNDNYNLKLSQKRAASAMVYLIEKGIDAKRLLSKGYGETKPLVDCKTLCTEDNYKANRRIEFIILD